MTRGGRGEESSRRRSKEGRLPTPKGREGVASHSGRLGIKPLTEGKISLIY